MKTFQLTLISSFIILFSACKKNDVTAPANGDNVNDSTLAFTKDIYLWYQQIPSTFNAKTYEDPNKIQTAIRQFSLETGFSAPVDRWSFAMRKQDWNNISSGVSADFGLQVFFRTEGDLRVRAVEKNSPAGSAGIERSWRITKINGNDNITTANANFITQAVYNSSTSSFTFVKPDNTTATISLSATSYQKNPIVIDTVYNIGNKKIGYFNFSSFLGDTTFVANEFNRIFSKFSNQNATDVVIDLRYNGGGYVLLQNQLANYLAPQSAHGSVMMQQKMNDKYSQHNSTTLFSKKGSLNINRVFIIVGSGTASASELLINNLKPYMEVHLIGPSKTYGKPVGYFPIPVDSWFIFPVSFRSTNKNGEGNYFNGFNLNHQVSDGLDKNWGDVTESCLASAINYITSGVYRPISGESLQLDQQLQPQVQQGNDVLDRRNFKGAIGSLR